MCVAKIPTGCFSLAKSELQQYLPPKQCLSNFIINHVAERLCLQENTMKDLTKWYHLVDANVHMGVEQARMNLRDSSQFMSVKQFFFPICKSSHFFLIVVNTEKLNVEVWDSLKREDITSYTSEIDIVLESLRTITKRTDSFSGYKRVLVDIPQQTNGYDCGLFVCYYLEYPNHVMKFHKEKWISDEQRLRLSSRILNSRHNTQRDLVYEYVEKWSKANESSSTPSSTPSATFKQPFPGKPKDTSPKKPKDTSPKKPPKKVARKCRVLKDLISPLPSGTKRLRRTLYRDSLRK